MIRLVIPGPPIAQPRHRVSLRGGIPRTYLARVKDKATGKAVEHPVVAYKHRIAVEASSSRGRMAGPVSVALRFFLPVPKKFRRWATDPMQRDLARQCKPDVDNLAKAVLDALSGTVFGDDARVVKLSIEKDCDVHPRTEIEVCALSAGNPV